MKTILLAITLLLSTGAVSAQSVAECDWRASAQAIAEPWDENTRTFSNGKTRLALLDTVEPAAGAYHLLVLSPPYSELGDRQCRVISFEDTIGFSEVEFAALDAGYDPARGLTFTVPVQYYDGAAADYAYGWLTLTLNQATGAIDPWIGGAE